MAGSEIPFCGGERGESAALGEGSEEYVEVRLLMRAAERLVFDGER